MSTVLNAILGGVMLLGLAGTTLASLRWRRAYQRARWRAEHDQLTGLPNRRRLDQDLAHTTRHTVVMLLDLDDFKQVNDTHGHHAGDHVLIQTALRLQDHTHTHGGRAYRLAGDEFLVIWQHWRPTDAPTRAAMLLDHLAVPVTLPWSATIVITPHATAGVTTSGSWPTRLLREADIALYHARAHRQRLAVHHCGMTLPGASPGRHGPRLRDRRPHCSGTHTQPRAGNAP